MKLSRKHDARSFVLRWIDEEGNEHTTTSIEHLRSLFIDGPLASSGKDLKHDTPFPAYGKSLRTLLSCSWTNKPADSQLSPVTNDAAYTAHNTRGNCPPSSAIAGQKALHASKTAFTPRGRKPGTRCSISESLSESSSLVDTAMPDAIADSADEEEESGDEQEPQSVRLSSFMISNTDAVKTFLLSRISKLHQLSNKKIAKAWIKGICPKKQAHFPYHNKQKVAKGEHVEVPGWWAPVPEDMPSVPEDLDGDELRRALELQECCPFTEPDHVQKHRKSPARLLG